MIVFQSQNAIRLNFSNNIAWAYEQINDDDELMNDYVWRHHKDKIMAAEKELLRMLQHKSSDKDKGKHAKKSHAHKVQYIHTLCPKKGSIKLSVITLSNLNRFSKFFHWRILQEICSQMVSNDPTTP